jgi:DNA repair protein SbcD/Mre11
MRILHTSDWHVGRSFHGRDLLTTQAGVLGGIADIVAGEGVDLVLIAGDLYDRALPSAEAVRVCGEALGRIRDAGAEIVVVSGNHDSASRLGFGAGFLAAGGLYIRADPAAIDKPILFGDVAVYGIPYLEPETARHALNVVTARSHEAVLSAAMEAIRADLAGRPGTRAVVLAHAFVTGGDGSDSERSIAVGGVETVPAGVFDGVDYVALGHLHGAQQPDPSRPWLRYSGSPLAYSFSEALQRKSVWLLDLDASGLGDVRRVMLPVPRPLSTLRGRIDDLLADPALAEVEDHFLAVTLTDRARPLEPMRRLQERFPHAVTLEWEPEGGRPTGDAPPRVGTGERDDVAVAASFVEYVRNTPVDEDEQLLLEAAFAAGKADR